MNHRNLNNRYRITVDLDGDWTQHTDALPANSIPLGTVTLREAVGALVKVGDGEDGDFLMITADFVHKLNARKVRAAIQLEAGWVGEGKPVD